MSEAIANLFSIQSSLVPGYNPANGNAFTEDVGTSTMQSGSPGVRVMSVPMSIDIAAVIN